MDWLRWLFGREHPARTVARLVPAYRCSTCGADIPREPIGGELPHIFSQGFVCGSCKQERRCHACGLSTPPTCRCGGRLQPCVLIINT